MNVIIIAVVAYPAQHTVSYSVSTSKEGSSPNIMDSQMAYSNCQHQSTRSRIRIYMTNSVERKIYRGREVVALSLHAIAGRPCDAYSVLLAPSGRSRSRTLHNITGAVLILQTSHTAIAALHMSLFFHYSNGPTHLNHSIWRGMRFPARDVHAVTGQPTQRLYTRHSSATFI